MWWYRPGWEATLLLSSLRRGCLTHRPAHEAEATLPHVRALFGNALSAHEATTDAPSTHETRSAPRAVSTPLAEVVDGSQWWHVWHPHEGSFHPYATVLQFATRLASAAAPNTSTAAPADGGACDGADASDDPLRFLDRVPEALEETLLHAFVLSRLQQQQPAAWTLLSCEACGAPREPSISEERPVCDRRGTLLTAYLDGPFERWVVRTSQSGLREHHAACMRQTGRRALAVVRESSMRPAPRQRAAAAQQHAQPDSPQRRCAAVAVAERFVVLLRSGRADRFAFSRASHGWRRRRRWVSTTGAACSPTAPPCTRGSCARTFSDATPS